MASFEVDHTTGQIVWQQDQIPGFSFERVLSEIIALTTASNDATLTDAQRASCHAALNQRMQNQDLTRAFNDIRGAVSDPVAKDATVDLVPEPTFGFDPQAGVKNRKDFVSAINGAVLSDPSHPKAKEIARQVFTSAKIIIEASSLNRKASLDLIRPAFSGTLTDLLSHYYHEEQYEAFAELVQEMCTPSSSSNTITNQLISLTNKRPDPKKLALLVSEIISLNRQLVADLPDHERDAIFKSNTRHYLDNILSLWYGVHREAVNTKFNKQMSAKTEEIRQAEDANNLDRARELKRKLCPVQTFSSILLQTLRNIEPSREINRMVAAELQPRKQVMTAEVLEEPFVSPEESFQREQTHGEGVSHHVMMAQRFSQQGPSVRARREPRPHHFTSGPQFPPRQGTQGARFRTFPMQTQQNMQQPPPLCWHCGKHPFKGNDGLKLPCFRYGDLSQSELREKCSACQFMHPTAKCRVNVPLRDIYKGVPNGRAEAPSARQGFFSNQHSQK